MDLDCEGQCQFYAQVPQNIKQSFLLMISLDNGSGKNVTNFKNQSAIKFAIWDPYN